MVIGDVMKNFVGLLDGYCRIKSANKCSRLKIVEEENYDKMLEGKCTYLIMYYVPCNALFFSVTMVTFHRRAPCATWRFFVVFVPVLRW